MRLFLLLPIVLVAACQSTAPTDVVGSVVWVEETDRALKER